MLPRIHIRPSLGAQPCVFCTNRAIPGRFVKASTPFERSRYFSATPRPRFLEPALEAMHTTFQAIHSTSGLPWAISIPATALLVRISLFPIAIYTRRLEQRQLALMPVLRAYMAMISRRAGEMSSSQSMSPVMLRLWVSGQLSQVSRDIMKRNGCSPWKRFWIGVGIQFPVFLGVMETLRLMAGRGHGLLGLGADGFKKFGSWLGLERGGRVTTADSASLSSSIANGETAIDAVTSSEASTMATTQPIIPMELGFADEGMLWFPDLLSADPELFLPLILSISLVINLQRPLSQRFNTASQNSAVASIPPSSSGDDNTSTVVASAPRPSKIAERLKKGMLFFSLMCFPLTLQMPAALMIYWISSTWLAFLQNLLLDRFMPLRKDFKGFRGEALAVEASKRARAEAEALSQR